MVPVSSARRHRRLRMRKGRVNRRRYPSRRTPDGPARAAHALDMPERGDFGGLRLCDVLRGGATGKSAAALLAEFVQAPLDPPAALVIWFAVVLIAGVYLWVGLHNAAEGAHAGLWAFWSAALPVVLTVIALHAPRLFANPFVLGCVLVAARWRRCVSISPCAAARRRVPSGTSSAQKPPAAPRAAPALVAIFLRSVVVNGGNFARP